MATSTRHDAWAAGDSYDAYMGRWSRPIAARFLDWLALPAGLDWLELGCGTGALTQALIEKCDPASVLAIDPSDGFIAKARETISGQRVTFLVGDAVSLSTMTSASRDVAVAALVLNFIPDRLGAIHAMKRIVRPGGTVGFYVWDYPGGGVEFMRAFWTAAVSLDPEARDLTEDRRFPFCTRDGLLELCHEAGFSSIEITAIESPTIFRDFEDFWLPFTLGAGPAPGYCVKLLPDARKRLRDMISDSLPRQNDGSIALSTRAWALKAQVTAAG